MTNNTNVGSKLAAIALTAIVSATMVLSAVGPATAVGHAPSRTVHIAA